MVVHDLDVLGIAPGPHEANSPLIIDPDRVLSGAIFLQCLKVIAREPANISEHFRLIQHDQLAACAPDKISRETLAGMATFENRLRTTILEGFDHGRPHSSARITP
jgi:hypothetical protein